MNEMRVTDSAVGGRCRHYPLVASSGDSHTDACIGSVGNPQADACARCLPAARRRRAIPLSLTPALSSYVQQVCTPRKAVVLSYGILY